MSKEHVFKVAFYIVAHADDWQLFMQPNVYHDLIAPDVKVVLIITTGGDAGADESYWRAREEGSKSSVRFCISPLMEMDESTGTRDFNSHMINYWAANAATTYFLRLPDGNLNGSGFFRYNFQSLSKLRAGQIPSITPVDKSTTYSDWKELCATVHSIINFESDSRSDICINYLNPDPITNPHDHCDHRGTGQLLQDIPAIFNMRQTLFAGYSVSNLQETLNAADLFWKAGMFAAYEKAVYDNSGYSTLKEDVQIYLRWCVNRASFITINM